MLARLLSRLPHPFDRLALRFDARPLATVEAVADFVHTRSSYVAQTALYGYLKARMGTRFRDYFEDDAFSAGIRQAALKLFCSCAADLAVFAVASADREGRLAPAERAALARYCFLRAAAQGLAESGAGSLPQDARRRFDARLAHLDWRWAGEGRNAFAGSERDLIRFAPVIDDFKELDGAIVMNSIRYRWRDIRRQLERRLDGPAVCTDWRARRAALSRPMPRKPSDPHR